LDKVALGESGIEQNGKDKMVRTKWHKAKVELDKMVWTKWH